MVPEFQSSTSCTLYDKLYIVLIQNSSQFYLYHKNTIVNKYFLNVKLMTLFFCSLLLLVIFDEKISRTYTLQTMRKVVA